jgi:hypothetical protein
MSELKASKDSPNGSKRHSGLTRCVSLRMLGRVGDRCSPPWFDESRVAEQEVAAPDL